MKFTGQELEQLQQALLNAFTLETLRQMLRFKLEKDLDVITTANGFNNIVFDLINIASKEGWLIQLISVAKDYNPNNQVLNAVTTTLLDKSKSKTTLNQSNNEPLSLQQPNNTAEDQPIYSTSLKKGTKCMKRGNIDTRTLLKHMQIADQSNEPKKSLTYILGCFEKRVTIYSQQVRALNLIYSLFVENYLKKDSKICIIGAGAAGLTAAVAASHKGCNVTLLERAGEPLLIFRNNPIRYLHPHIYDWPEENSANPNANLPLMNWQAGLARDVISQLHEQWNRFKSKVKFVPQVKDIDITLSFQPEVSFNSNSGFNRDIFDVLILAVGFGEEKSNKFPVVPYWANDRYDEISPDGTNKHYLVAGCGDGGLTDLLRLRLKDFRHENIITNFFSSTNPAQLSKLKQDLLDIEKQALNQPDSPSYLFQKYQQLHVPQEIDDSIKAHLREDTNVRLNGKSKSPLTLDSSILNRFLASRLVIKFGTHYIAGELQDTPLDNGKRTASIEGKEPRSFDEVVIRFGPTPTINTFSTIFARCQHLKNRNELDQTRWPIWEETFFANPF